MRLSQLISVPWLLCMLLIGWTKSKGQHFTCRLEMEQFCPRFCVFPRRYTPQCHISEQPGELNLMCWCRANKRCCSCTKIKNVSLSPISLLFDFTLLSFFFNWFPDYMSQWQFSREHHRSQKVPIVILPSHSRERRLRRTQYSSHSALYETPFSVSQPLLLSKESILIHLAISKLPIRKWRLLIYTRNPILFPLWVQQSSVGQLDFHVAWGQNVIFICFYLLSPLSSCAHGFIYFMTQVV